MSNSRTKLLSSNSTIESPEERRSRWRSIRILYVTMFFDSLSFSIVLSSLYPYLQKIDPEVNPMYVGWANIGFQVAGVLMDFFMGYLTNKRGSTIPLHISLFFFGLGNLLYGYAQSCGSNGVAVVMVARAVIGLSTGTNVVTRVVAAESTTLKERTTVMAHMSIAQGVGFSFGPVAQLIALPLGDKGVYIRALHMHLNLYTAPAFFSIVVAVLNALAIVLWYREHKVDIYRDHEDDEKVQKYKDIFGQDEDSGQKLPRNTIAIIVNLVLYFAVQNAFALQETILAPFTMDMFAWTGEQTTLWVSLIFLAAGVVAIIAFVLADILQKRFNERMLLLCGLVLISIGFTAYLPWGSRTPIVKNDHLSGGNSTSSVGCPSEYQWCHHTPQVHLYQVICGMVLLSVGYPLALVYTTSIYSKILSPNPQGLMQSCLAATGGIARTAGPSLVTFLYIFYGPRWTFICADAFVILSILLLIAVYKRLVPYHKFVLKTNKQVVSLKNEHLMVVETEGSSTNALRNSLRIEMGSMIFDHHIV